VKHLVPHPLSRADAKRAIETAFGEYAQRYARFSPTLQWVDPETASAGFEALGRRISARVRLLDAAFEVELDVPLVARPFVGRAQKAIEREAARWVSVIQQRPAGG
jgi:hypothetical protein